MPTKPPDAAVWIQSPPLDSAGSGSKHVVTGQCRTNAISSPGLDHLSFFDTPVDNCLITGAVTSLPAFSPLHSLHRAGWQLAPCAGKAPRKGSLMQTGGEEEQAALECQLPETPLPQDTALG